MIQRIQTIFLLAGGLLLLIPVFFGSDLASVSTEQHSFRLTAFSAYSAQDGVEQKAFSAFPILILTLLTVGVSLFSIFQFKKRKFQIKMIQAAMLLQLVVCVVVFFYADKLAQLASNSELKYNPILVVFVLTLVLFFLAIRAIKKDEALVRSADRLR